MTLFNAQAQCCSEILYTQEEMGELKTANSISNPHPSSVSHLLPMYHKEKELGQDR